MEWEEAKEEQMEEILKIYREARQFMREQGNPTPVGGSVSQPGDAGAGYEKRRAVCLPGRGRNRRSFYVFYRDRANL